MKEFEIYLEMVRASLWGKEQVVWPVEQTDALLRLHATQGTGALVFPKVLGQEGLPTKAGMQMKSLCVHTMQQHVQLQHKLVKAWKALEDAGIQAVLMKGGGLAALYDEPQLRAWGDIDLFVGKEQYHPACAVMRDIFPDALKFDEELDHYKHYNIIADGVSIETHRVSVSFSHPTDEKRYALMEAYGKDNGEWLMVNGLKVKVFEPTFNALFVCLHSWEHMMTQGANVRQLCDLALLLHRNKYTIDRVLLLRWLEELHLLDVWQLYAYMLVNGLGLPRDEALFYTESVAPRANKLMEDLLAGRMTNVKAKGEGTKGERAPKNRFLRKFHTMRERMRNARRIGQYSPAYARHMKASILVSGFKRLFAKDRRWE